MYFNRYYFVYIATNKHNTVLYTSITNNLLRRMYEHRNKLNKGFTSKYNISKLIYYEVFDEVNIAIAREKQIKGGSRIKKIKLVQKKNSQFKDLFHELL